MTVSAGEYLGGNGATGVARGTEPHLHFSMYRGSEATVETLSTHSQRSTMQFSVVA